MTEFRRVLFRSGPQNALVLDYLLRLQGSSNPNVIRAPATADDAAAFAGSGLTPIGAVTRINDQFVNLQPQTVQGIDLALLYRIRQTGIGDFDLNLNAARLTKYSRGIPPAVQSLFDARAAGTIDRRDRKSTRLNSSHGLLSRMPSSA